MTSLFLYSFYVGFGLTLVSVILGFLNLGGDAGDLSHGGHLGPGGDLSLDAGGDLSVDLATDVPMAHDGSVGKATGKAVALSPVNFQTLVAALMGFGGAGYLTSHYGAPVALAGAAAGGFATGWLVYRFQRFLLRGERPLPPTRYTGIVGRLTVPIREGGTGEVVYTLNQTRTVSAARSVDGRPIPKGEEVVILRYERGIAYVQPWREFMKEENLKEV